MQIITLNTPVGLRVDSYNFKKRTLIKVLSLYLFSLIIFITYNRYPKMKKITTSLFLTAILISLCACKSGKASCDAYGKVNTENISDQASK